ncbi:MAG: hypothetical protein H7A52_04505 [Akkermansiaceae bacterium]|nr:hypothetical protein [Akkermansiaceae bacterium]
MSASPRCSLEGGGLRVGVRGDRADDGGGIEPDVVSFTTLLSKAADYESASGVIERMTEAGIEPNVVSFTTLLSRGGGLRVGVRGD